MPPALPGVRLGTRRTLLDDRPDGRSVHIFHSYCETFGRRWCATRRVHDGDWPASMLQLDGQTLDFGEDPRLFVHNGRPAIVAVTHIAGYGMRNHLYEIHDGTFTRSILLLPEDLAQGKNWSPFTAQDGGLGFVHGFDPPTILYEVRREHGVIVLGVQRGERVVTERGPGDYPAFRGGSNGVPVAGFTLGIGHTTRFRPGEEGSNVAALGFDHLLHRPFGWVLGRDERTLRVFDIEGDFPAEFDVIDPTSLIALPDGGFALFTTEVNRHFHDPDGRRQVACYHFDLDAEFRRAAAFAVNWDWLPPSRFLSQSARLGDEAWLCPVGGQSGHVISGPYVRLQAGRYRAVFHLTSSVLEGAGVIGLDVCAGAHRVLASRQIGPAEAMANSDHAIDFTHTNADEDIECRIAVHGFDGGLLRFDDVHHQMTPGAR